MLGKKNNHFIHENGFNCTISNLRSQNFLTLRKKKILKKNLRAIQNNKQLFFNMDLFSELPQFFHEQYSHLKPYEKIDFFSQIIITSKEQIYISFAIYQIRNLLENIPSKKELDNILSEKHLKVIILCLSQDYNENEFREKLIFEILKIIEYIIKLSPEHSTEIIENNFYLNSIINILSKYRNLLLWNQVLIIIGNLIQIKEWELLKKILQVIQLHQFLNNLLVERLSELIEMQCLSNIIWNYSLIFKYIPRDLLQNIFVHIKYGIEIICKLTKGCLSQSDFNEIINCLIYVFNNIEYEFYKNIILTTSLVKNLSGLININESIDKPHHIFILFNILFSKNKNFTAKLFSEEIIEKLNYYFEDCLNENIELPEEILIEFITLINYCCKEMNLRTIICQPNNLLSNLITFQSRITSNKVLKLLFKFFIELMECEKLDKDNIYIELIRIGLPEILFFHFDNIYNKNKILSNEKKDIVILILQQIIHLLIYVDLLFGEKNLIIEKFNYLGDFKQMLENLIIQENENSELIQISKEILITYYKS